MNATRGEQGRGAALRALTGLGADLDLGRDGARLRSSLATPILAVLEDVLAACPDDRAGVRIAGALGLARLLGPDLRGVRRPRRWRASGQVRPVDKSDTADWALGWYRDRTIAMRAFAEAPGFGLRTVKQGIAHVEPPFAVIRRHARGPHPSRCGGRGQCALAYRAGIASFVKVSSAGAEAVATSRPIHACLAVRGGVWAHCTPILDASNAARPGRRHRVLQVDYASRDLPAGLEWLGI